MCVRALLVSSNFYDQHTSESSSLIQKHSYATSGKTSPVAYPQVSEDVSASPRLSSLVNSPVPQQKLANSTTETFVEHDTNTCWPPQQKMTEQDTTRTALSGKSHQDSIETSFRRLQQDNEKLR